MSLSKIMRTLSLIILVAMTGYAHANLNIQIRANNRTTATKKLDYTKMENIDYICLEDLGKTFKSIIREERQDQRILFYINGEQFIFLINSPYYTYKTVDYNMHYPLRRQGSRFMVPSLFITEHLPLHFKTMKMVGRDLQIPAPEDRSVRTIVLDPGHGGKDPGAVGRKGLKEKDVNLAVTLKLKRLIEQELDIEVLLTRSDDRFVSLQDRTKFANDKRADLFISIHANASKSRDSKGIETYYLSTARTTEARAVEALENSVVEIYEGGKQAAAKYDDLAIILSDILQAEHLEGSNDLATQIQMNLVAGTKGIDRGVKQANFYVL
ncbi:MAG: N-acetylmuramoyl-L-alanine amidase, partial [Candidatus Cloacimonadaceae bacterium]|nr:N-acetylmuramoyl-L-alanine amidase [Candidatus Cloacimonadaceae bacterium]